MRKSVKTTIKQGEAGEAHNGRLRISKTQIKLEQISKKAERRHE